MISLDNLAGAAHSSHESVRQAKLIHALLDEAVVAEPAARAVRDPSGGWSYARLAELSHAFDGWLRSRGVGSGDRIVVQLPTTRELVAMCYGTSRRGAVFVPLSPEMKSYHLRSVLDNAEPRLVIVADRSVEEMRGIATVAVHGLGPVWREVEDLAGQTVRPEPAKVTTGDVAVLIYTSGSTAAPKAVMCPHAQMTFASAAINAVLEYRPDDVVFCRFPMSWDVGLYEVLQCCLSRCELVLANGESDLVLLKRIRESSATVVPIVPTLAGMIVTLARREAEPAPRVRMFTNTGAALPQATIDSLRESFPGARVVRQFGQTECKRITIMPPELDRERPDSVGCPLPGTEVLVLDADGCSVPTGQTGEIVVTGPHVMPGYWQSPELTAHTFRRDAHSGALRLHTGDYGHLDEDGYLYFEGRRDDMFKRKGIRMSTIEIEAAAMDIPGIRAAAVLPPDDGRELALFVDSDLPPYAVLRELAQRLEAAKVPPICRVVTNLPLTPHGKNDRKKLALLLEEEER